MNKEETFKKFPQVRGLGLVDFERWRKDTVEKLEKRIGECKKQRREHCLDFPNAPASPLWERNYGKQQAYEKVLEALK